MKDLKKLGELINDCVSKGLPFKDCLDEANSFGNTGRLRRPSEELIKKVKSAFDSHEKNNFISANNNEIILTPLKDLLNEPDIDMKFLVQDILPSCGFSIIGSRPKVGKSTFARQLSLCVSLGEPFLNKDTIQGSVIYLALEEIRGQVKSHFKMMGAIGEEKILSHISRVPKDAMSKLYKIAKKEKPALVIIDPLFRFVRVKDTNDYGGVTAALEPFISMARELNTHVMLVHHLTKANRSGGDGLLGSTAIFGSVDTAIILNQTEGSQERTIQTIQRYGDSMPETALNFNPETGTVSLGHEKEYEALKKVEDEILDYLKSQDEPVTEPEIKSNVSGTNEHKTKGLRNLLSLGIVYREGEGKKGNPYKYFVLKS
jgi:RecA-family ATPase